jgi:phage terminase large subunit-like protein
MTTGLPTSLACQPRFGTKRTGRATLGPQVAAVGVRLGITLSPFQQLIADVAFELNADGSLVYREIVILVGRQEGKTALKFVVMMHRLVVMSQTHGPQRVTYTMQDRKKARVRLERDYAVRLRGARGFKEIPSTSRARPVKQTQWRLGANSGTEHIQFGPASYMQIDTPSRTGGHGDTLDAGFIDEAFAHEDDTVETGMEPALLIPADSQMWVLSASGDAKSKYLYRKVVAGRKLIEEGCDEGTAYFEWSAPDDANPGDPEVWRSSCPALGIRYPGGGGLTEAKMADLWARAQRKGQEGIDLFCRSYLCMWPEVPVLEDSVTFRVIDQEGWNACCEPGHRPSGELRYALDVDVDANGDEWCSIAVSDGYYVQDVTPIGAVSGTAWVVGEVVKHRNDVGELVIDPAGPAGKLVAPLEKAGITLRKVTAQESTQADMHLVERVAQREVCHIGQPRLDAAVATVVRRDVGDGAWRFSRSLSLGDISTLKATSFAYWIAIDDDAGYYGGDD